MKDSHKADWGNSICSTGTLINMNTHTDTQKHENPLMKHQLLLLTMLPTNISNSIVTDFSNCEYHAPGPFQLNWIRVRSLNMKNTLFKCFFNKNVSLVCQETPKLTLLSLFCLLHHSENSINSRFAPPPESWPYEHCVPLPIFWCKCDRNALTMTVKLKQVCAFYPRLCHWGKVTFQAQGWTMFYVDLLFIL